MLITIERVAALKSVEIFSHTPDYILAELAAKMEERDFSAGEIIIEKDTLENLMYIIVEGEVEIHDGDKTLAVFGPGESVGEMQVLDPAPRSASVTARADCVLLSIEKLAFDEVLADQPEMAKDVIKVLTRRLRNITALHVSS